MTSVAPLNHEPSGTSGAPYSLRMGHPARRSPAGRGRGKALPPAPPPGAAAPPVPRGCREGKGEEAERRHSPTHGRAPPPPDRFPARPARHVAAAAGAAGSRGAGSMRGARSGPGAERRPAGAHPAQWVLIAPGNPAGAALPQRRALRPAGRLGQEAGDRPRGWAGAGGGRAPPGCAKAALRHGLYTRPRTVPALPLQRPRFPRWISAFNLYLSLGFCQGLLPPVSLMGSRCLLLGAGGPPCLYPFIPFLQFLKETVQCPKPQLSDRLQS